MIARIAILFALVSGVEPAPKPAIIMPCHVVEWYDGDTGTVLVTIPVRVRLLDCWAPEVKGAGVTADEKKRGQAALTSIQQLAPSGTRAVLEIPLDGYDRSDDAFTMGRVLGRVWVNGKNLSAVQVDSGHARAVK